MAYMNYEAAGRVLTAMLETTAPLGGSGLHTHSLHLWGRLEGGWCVEWTGGPHAEDVFDDLVALSNDTERSSTLSPGDVVPLPDATDHGLAMQVRGTVFALRPIDTVGTPYRS